MSEKRKTVYLEMRGDIIHPGIINIIREGRNTEMYWLDSLQILPSPRTKDCPFSTMNSVGK
jgi:hypothetical protein